MGKLTKYFIKGLSNMMPQGILRPLSVGSEVAPGILKLFRKN